MRSGDPTPDHREFLDVTLRPLGPARTELTLADCWDGEGMDDEGEEAEHTGEYLEIDRPRRLVFTLSVDRYSPYVDRIVVDIVPLESGCELTITHEMHPDMAEYVVRAEQGWSGIMETLATRL